MRTAVKNLLLWMCVSQVNVFAGVVTAASCSQSDINSAIASSSTGDIITIPAGTCTWTTTKASTPSVSIAKAITLQGQTTCTGRAATLSCVDATIIYDGTGTASTEVLIEIDISGVRVTGFTFLDTRSVTDSNSAILVDSSATGWRIDHCHFHPTNTNHTRAMLVSRYGLIDHNLIEDALNGVSPRGDMAGDAERGDQSWTEPMSFGTAKAIYMEDNLFNYTGPQDGAYDSYSGARLVFRYNDVRGTTVGGHGLDSGGLRSVLQAEVYSNTFSNSGTHRNTMINTRGGSDLVWGNTVSAAGGSYDSFFSVQNYRSDSAYPYPAGPCDGTNVLDQNTAGQQGYACKDQVGRGTNQAFYPQYAWGNTFKGAAPTISAYHICGYQDCGRAQTYHLLNNRDFYLEAASFDGTSGTGTGLLSAQPSTCTAGVGYWATDRGSFYQCSSTNTWAVYYTPYTYPHPLQALSSQWTGSMTGTMR